MGSCERPIFRTGELDGKQHEISEKTHSIRTKLYKFTILCSFDFEKFNLHKKIKNDKKKIQGIIWSIPLNYKFYLKIFKIFDSCLWHSIFLKLTQLQKMELQLFWNCDPKTYRRWVWRTLIILFLKFRRVRTIVFGAVVI